MRLGGSFEFVQTLYIFVDIVSCFYGYLSIAY